MQAYHFGTRIAYYIKERYCLFSIHLYLNNLLINIFIMEDLFKKGLYAGIGLITVAAERMESTVKELIEKGKLSEIDGKRLIDDFFKTTEHKKEEFEEKIKRATEEVVTKFNSSRGSNLDHLVARIEAIEAKLGITVETEAKTEEKVEEVPTV